MNSLFKEHLYLGGFYAVWLVDLGCVAAAGSVIGQFGYWVRPLFSSVDYLKGLHF